MTSPERYAYTTRDRDVAVGGGAGVDSWLKWRHPLVDAKLERWAFIRDVYTGDLLLPDKIRSYLIQKAQGETNDAYLERTRCADYTPHFPVIIDSLVGMLARVEANASRVWGAADDTGVVGGLGDPAVAGTEAHRLWRDADGAGTSYLSLWSQAATELALMFHCWLFVDPADGVPVLRLLPVESVVNWIERDGRLIEALLLETIDDRTSLRQDKPRQIAQYLHLTLDGWARYRVDASGRSRPVPGGEGSWEREWRTLGGEATIPLVNATLPMRREVSFLTAKKGVAIFNRESERDHLLRHASFPKLFVDGDEHVYNAVVDALQRGANVLQGKHAYDAPPTEPAAMLSEVVEKKARELYLTSFREYGDAAATKTATEVRQDVAAGANAFLAVLSDALDGLEQRAMHFLEQAIGLDEGGFTVHRSDEFLPADEDVVVSRMLARVFGADAKVPVGRTARVAAAKAAAEHMGLAYDPQELEAAVAAEDLLAAFDRPSALPFPAEVRVRAMAKVLASGGFVEADEEVTLADGQKVKLLTLIEAQATEIARAEDVARRREAETFGLGGGGDPPSRRPGAGDDDEDDEDDDGDGGA